MKLYMIIILVLLTSSILFSENVIYEKDLILENVSFRAINNPYIEVHYQYRNIYGLLMGMRLDSVLININDEDLLPEIVAIPLSEIYFIKREIKSNILQSSFTGFAAGAVFGGVWGFMDGDDKPEEFLTLKAEQKALFIGGCFSLIGALTGYVISHGEYVETYDLTEYTYYQKVKVISNLCGY